MAQDKRIQRELNKLAKAFGRTVRIHKGHYKLEHPKLPPTTASGSPKNIDHMLRAVKRDLMRYQGEGRG